jgi:hypothetical protein
MKLIKSIKILVLLTGCLICIQPVASQTIIQSTIDSTMLMIGEQTKVQWEVISDKNKHVILPVVSESLIDGVWVLETGKPDTIIDDNDRMSIKQQYLITSFDSALYVIPPFQVIDGPDTLLSNSLILKVMTFPDVDPSKGITDIKPVVAPDFSLLDYCWYAFGILGGLCLLCVIVYILQKWKKQEPLFLKKEAPKLPPHAEAVQQLDRIKAEKLWQRGKYKEYYSGITDVLRKYIVDRFDVSAMEMTSEEILSEINRLNDALSVYNTLKQILELADLVKFAKYVPLPDNNEISIMNAYLFVNQTKIEELKLSENEKITDNSTDMAVHPVSEVVSIK